jgi:hypothetical protein
MAFNISGVSSLIDAAYRIIWSTLRLMGVVVGLFPKAGKLSRNTYVAIHYFIICCTIAVLAFYSNRLVPEASVTVPFRFVQRFYVAITFVALYLVLRVSIAAYLLFMSRDVSEFDDINQAFEAGLEELAREGFDLQWLPVFLISGASPEQQKSIIEASKIPWKVNCSSDDPRFATLSFHASDEALFICLNDVGAMSRQQKKGASKGGPATKMVSNPGVQATMTPDAIRAAVQGSSCSEQSSGDAGRTLPPGRVAAIVGATIPPGGAKVGSTLPPGGGGFGRTMQPGEIARAAETSNKTAAVQSSFAGAAPAGLEKLSKDELRYERRRLEYFCQILATERGPYCPLNGLLQVIPLKWTQSRSDTYKDLMEAIKVDLQAMHDTFHMQFPVVCMHSGLEELIGLKEFVERGNEINSRFKDSRAGSHYPSGLVIDEKSSSWVVERGLIWFRDWVYAEFAKNLADPKNRQLYQFLCSLALRRDRLAREIQTVVGELKLQQPVRLKGCYFAATGKEPARQAFVHDLILRLMSEQNDVAYLPEFITRDSRCRLIAVVLFFLTLLVFGLDLWLGWQIFDDWSRR